MLTIRNTDDLHKYLKTRLEMARGQVSARDKNATTQALGMIFAFEESIKAVEALMSNPTFDNDDCFPIPYPKANKE